MKETAVATDFTGKTTLITGAGARIGCAVALGLADARAGPILLGRSPGQLAAALGCIQIRAQWQTASAVIDEAVLAAENAGTQPGNRPAKGQLHEQRSWTRH
jgi:NAD(P)-dependent dehydrogenase (short-subunit alcohol dehydrogenase family)